MADRYQVDSKGQYFVHQTALDGRTRWSPVEGLPPNYNLENLENSQPESQESQDYRDPFKPRPQLLDIMGRDPDALRRYSEAKAMGPMDSAGIAMIREAGKFKSGAGEMFDFLRDVVTPGGSEKSMNSSIARRKKNEYEDRIFREFHEASPIASILGPMPLYQLGGIVGGPIANKIGAATIDQVIDKTVEGTRKGAGLIGRGVKKVASKGQKESPYVNDPNRSKVANYIGGLAGATAMAPRNAVTRMAGEIDEGIVEPLVKSSQARQARPKTEDFFRKNISSDIGGSALLGAGEGMMHYDMSPVEGAVSSFAGQMGGRVVEPFLVPGPKNLTPANRENVDWWAGEGYRVDPGMDTGRPELQKRHDSRRKSPKYQGVTAITDQANDKVVSKVAARAMGLNQDQFDSLTPGRLQDHMTDLRGQYNKLENESTGFIENHQLTNIGNEIADKISHLPKGQQNTIKSLFDEMSNMKANASDVNVGRSQFSGSEFQALRSKIQAAKSTAYGNSNNELGDSLNTLIKELDKGMENGVRSRGGKAKAGEWRDLNERYAMSQILMNKGMTPGFQVDKAGLSRYLMGDDAGRLLQEQGGRIKDFQRIARLHDLERSQRKQLFGDSEETSGDSDWSPETPTAGVTTTPNAAKVGLIRKAGNILYEAGWPANTGLLGPTPLGMRSEGIRSPTSMNRAASMSHNTASEKILPGIVSGWESVGDMWDWVGEQLSGDDGIPISEEEVKEYLKKFGGEASN